ATSPAGADRSGCSIPCCSVAMCVLRPLGWSTSRFFFFKQKTAYEIGLGIPAEPLFRSHVLVGCGLLMLKVSRLKLPVIWLLVSMWLNTLTKSQIWTLLLKV